MYNNDFASFAEMAVFATKETLKMMGPATLAMFIKDLSVEPMSRSDLDMRSMVIEELIENCGKNDAKRYLKFLELGDLVD